MTIAGTSSLPAVTLRPSSTGTVVAGYIRESAGDALNDAEREGQRSTIRRLAERDGIDPQRITWYDDWGYSGRRSDRPRYVALRADIAEGRVQVVYARSVDRLGRDEQEGIALEDFARVQSTRIVTDRDGERTLDPDAQNTLIRYIPHLIAAEESRLGRLRAREARRTRLARLRVHRETCSREQIGGQADDVCRNPQHWDGQPPYGRSPGEDIGAVVQAFRANGSFVRAAAELNRRRLRPRQATRSRTLLWSETTVRRIIRHENARLRLGVRFTTRAGQRRVAVHVLSGLVRCPRDGSVLTGTWRTTRRTQRTGEREAAYFCRVGRVQHDHPRPYSVQERVLRDWLMAMTGMILGAEQQPIEHDDPNIGEVAALRARREWITQGVQAGFTSTDDAAPMLANIDAEIGRLSAEDPSGLTFRLGFDWTLDDRSLNSQLRAVMAHVELDAGFRPLAAVWTREPVTGEEDIDGNPVPDPRAVRVADGWRLPFRAGS
jgi:DNA invertase Pin-like site-specific DNA recombinase